MLRASQYFQPANASKAASRTIVCVIPGGLEKLQGASDGHDAQRAQVSSSVISLHLQMYLIVFWYFFNVLST